MNKIQRISAWGYGLSWAIAALVFLTHVMVWITAPNLFDQMHPSDVGRSLLSFYGWLPTVPTIFSATTKWVGFLITLIPNLLFVYCWLIAACLFKSFRHNAIYANDNVQRLRRVGWTLLIAEVLRIPMQLGLSAFLTLSAGTHHGQAVISLSINDFGIIAVSILLLLIAAVIHEGVQLKQENESII